mgnify:CR=1 FL=1
MKQPLLHALSAVLFGAGCTGHFYQEETDRALREETPRLGLWVDSSALTVAETADHILANLDAASVS